MYGRYVRRYMAADGQETERTAVKTYIPAYQRDIWDEHAAELDMNRSEFVRSMVQAGRRGFDPGGSADETGSQDSEDSEGAEMSSGTPATSPEDGGSDIQERVLDLLEEDCLSWDELFDALTDDIGDRLDETLQQLQAENEIHHSGRDGGYVPAE